MLKQCYNTPRLHQLHPMPSHHSPRSKSTKISIKKKCEKNTILYKTELEVGALMENISDGLTSPLRRVFHPRQAKSNPLIGLSHKIIICTLCPPYAYSHGMIWSHISRVLEIPRPPIRKIGRRSYPCKGRLEARTYWLRNKRVINNSYEPITLQGSSSGWAFIVTFLTFLKRGDLW